MADNGGPGRQTGRRWLWIIAGIAVVGAAGAVVGIWHLPDRMYPGSDTDVGEARAALQAGLLTAAAALLAVAGGLIALDETRRANRDTHVRELYVEAAKLLNDPDTLGVRLAGIYALERIATDSPADQRTIVEVLSAFARERSTDPALRPPSPDDGTTIPVRPAADIRATVQVLARLPARAGAPRADLSGADLTGPASLALLTLTGANLTDAQLDGANLTGAQLEKANLTGAQLGGVTLIDAWLFKATLTNAHLERADLTGAYLIGANLPYARLNGATLTGAHLGKANLRRARLEEAILTGADLDGANLTGSWLEAANLTDAQLVLATLTGARLERSILTGARLERATLAGAGMEGANLANAWLHWANLTDARLGRATLTDAHLPGANLTNARLEGADLTGSWLEKANLTGAQLAGANLTNARGLTQEQVEAASGDEATHLPAGLVRPASWPPSDDTDVP